MSANGMSRRVLSVAVIVALLAVLGPAVALAGTPDQFLLASHFGRAVDATAGANVCTVLSGDECVRGSESSEPGGFLFPTSVAVDSAGDVYVDDRANARVQELGPSGSFIAMFGSNVNKTKVAAGGSAAERDVCTAASGDTCQAGEEGNEPGQFEQMQSIAVDPASGGVLTAEDAFGEVNGEFALGGRVQEFTATGQFVLEIGSEVNETTKANLCTQAEVEATHVKCRKQTVHSPGANKEHGAFTSFPEGNVLAIGGPEGLLYVGDEGRVQEFKTTGEWKAEVSLGPLAGGGQATGVAVDPGGELFVADSEVPGVHEFNAAGQLQAQVIEPTSGAVHALAINPNGQLGIVAFDPVAEGARGFIYSTTGAKISEFDPPSGPFTGFPSAIAFAPAAAPSPDELYVVDETAQEIEAYDAVEFATLRTCPAEQITASSAQLCGEVNPNGVLTNAFFEYGTTPALASRTPSAFTGSGSTLETVHATVALIPNQTYHFKLAGEAQVKGKPLTIAGPESEFHTPVIAPQILGPPTASFITAHSAVLSASLNPEHTTTRRHFEYGPCPTLSGCASISSTPVQESAQAAEVGAVQEIQGLAAQTIYSYRLVANNEFEENGSMLGGAATGAEGAFTTGASPTVSASTGEAGSISATSAVISGTVNPDGQPATYTFELGVYEGASTSYGLVFSASAGAETTLVGESHQLSGLQPGTVYAYRIAIHGGYGQATGATETFTTTGLPSALTAPTPLPQLAIPSIAFPSTEPPITSPRPRKATRAELLARAKRACKKEAKKRRLRCERNALARYRPKGK